MGESGRHESFGAEDALATGPSADRQRMALEIAERLVDRVLVDSNYCRGGRLRKAEN